MDVYWVRFSYGLSITTYLDRAVSDEDRQETIQSFSQLFHSLAGRDFNSYAQRFKNKATESKLLSQSSMD